jgi:hypothetical protein
MNEFVKFIAENWENEQEYAGRMETWCFYCGEYQEPGKPETHNDGCLHIKALAIVNAAKQRVQQTVTHAKDCAINVGMLGECDCGVE